MKSNNVKSLIAILWIAVLFTGLNSKAAWVWPSPADFCKNWVFPECSDFINNSRSIAFVNAWNDYSELNNLNYYSNNYDASCYECYMNNVWSFYLKSSYAIGWRFPISWNLLTYNNWDYLIWRSRINNWTAYYWKTHFMYNFINYTKDWEAPVYHWRNDITQSYNYVNYAYLPDLPDLNNTGDSFYFVQPWHASWIFYNYLYDIDLKTVQYIWNQVLRDKFLFVDTLAANDNVWLVDTNLNKAWSYTETDINILSDFLFWKIKFSDDFFNIQPWSSYYDITLNYWWNSFLPPTVWNYVGSNAGSKSFKWFNIWLSYNKIYDFVGPNYWSDTSNNTTSWSVVSSGEIRTYESCINEITTIKNIASLEYACRNTINDSPFSWFGENPNFTSDDFNNLYNFIWTYNWTWENPSSKNVSCSNWLIKSTQLYFGAWSWNYSRMISTSNAWSIDPNSYDPVNYCGDYPSSSSEQVWYCRVFNIGCSDDFNFWWVYNSVRYYFAPFINETLDEYKRYYMSWYNYLWEINKCSSDFYWKSYDWWNFALLFSVAWLWFVLYSVFKD